MFFSVHGLCQCIFFFFCFCQVKKLLSDSAQDTGLATLEFSIQQKKDILPNIVAYLSYSELEHKPAIQD